MPIAIGTLRTTLRDSAVIRSYVTNRMDLNSNKSYSKYDPKPDKFNNSLGNKANVAHYSSN